MQILRRPKDEPPARSAKSSSGTATPPKTLEEKEEAYRIARERIFGPSASSEPATPAPPAAGPSKSPIPHQIPTQIRSPAPNAYPTSTPVRPVSAGAVDGPGYPYMPNDVSGAWSGGGSGVRVGGGWVSSTTLGGNLWAPPPAGVPTSAHPPPRFALGVDGRSLPASGRQSPSNVGGVIRQPRGPSEFGSGFGA